jgi:TAG lipase/lysophosphatidylethanolamine acyltransferase
MAPQVKTDTWMDVFYAACMITADILLVWTDKFVMWMTATPVKTQLLDRLREATTFDDWQAAATSLDDLPENYEWHANPTDRMYQYKMLEEHRRQLRSLRNADNITGLIDCLRHALLRGMFGTIQLQLYKKTYCCTKQSIHRYIEEVTDSIRAVANAPTRPTTSGGRLSPQALLDSIKGARATYGSTALMLQGGSIFGLCHLGVVKALLAEGILPNVIVGTATGALMAALVGIHTRDELPDFLSGENLDLSAFAAASSTAKERTAEQLSLLGGAAPTSQLHNWHNIFRRRAYRLAFEGFLLNPDVLNECVKANVGDITFEEAYNRTGFVLNIIISSPSEEIPELMNYLTAPNVLIRSAAMVSHITNMSRARTAPIQLLSKDRFGVIHTVEIHGPAYKPRKSRGSRKPIDHPTRRLRQQFNIDHFIICQARPYLAPFIQPSLPYIRGNNGPLVTRVAASLIKHALIGADRFHLLPEGLSRIMSDEKVVGERFTLVPEITLRDWNRLLKNPDQEQVQYWILKGEKTVWPSLGALRVRMAIETALDEAWEQVRTRRGGLTERQSEKGLAVLPPQPAYRADEDDGTDKWEERQNPSQAHNMRKRRSPVKGGL